MTFQSFTINVSMSEGTIHHGIISDIFTSHTIYFTQFIGLSSLLPLLFLINKFALFLIIHLISQVYKSEKFSSCHILSAFQSHCNIHKILTLGGIISQAHFFENSSK
jgi:hypothetical protein